MPGGFCSGALVQGYAINPPVFLAGLKSILESRGVRFLTQEADSFGQVAQEFTPAVIINATGIGARKLAKDETVRPYRGHCIRILLDHEPDQVMNSADEEAWCVPVGSGECRIGTTFEPNCWDTNPDKTAIQGILERVQAILPATCGKLDPARIIQVSCGLRPGRDEGVRLEHEQYREQPDQQPVDIVHCYGHRGDGFGLGPGSALDAYALVKKILRRK